MAYNTSGWGMVGSQRPPASSFGADGTSPNYLPGPNGQRPSPRPPASSFGADGTSPNYLPGPNGQMPGGSGWGMVGSQFGGYGGVSDMGGGYTGSQTGGGTGGTYGGMGGIAPGGTLYQGNPMAPSTGLSPMDSAMQGFNAQGSGFGMVGSQTGGTPDYAANYAAADAMRTATPASMLPAGFGGGRAGAERMAQGIQDATRAKWGRTDALRAAQPQMSEADYSAGIQAGNDAFNASGGGFGGVQGAGQNTATAFGDPGTFGGQLGFDAGSFAPGASFDGNQFGTTNPFGVANGLPGIGANWTPGSSDATGRSLGGMQGGTSGGGQSNSGVGGIGMVGLQGGGTLGGPGDVGSKATDAFNQYRAIQAGQPLPDTGGAWTPAGSSGSGSSPITPGGQAMPSYGYDGAPQLGTGPAGTGYGLTDLGGQSGQGSFSGSSPNGYLGQMADEIQRRSSQELGRTQQANRSNSIGSGGFGGGRQGVAEALSTSLSQDSLQGNLANLFGGQYNQDANRGLQRYQGDQNNGTQRYQADQNYDINSQNTRNQFYTQNRQLDQSGAQLGANLFSQGSKGEWDPLNEANGIYGGYSGFGSQTNGGSGGSDWEKILGGLMSGGSFAQNMGWLK